MDFRLPPLPVITGEMVRLLSPGFVAFSSAFSLCYILRLDNLLSLFRDFQLLSLLRLLDDRSACFHLGLLLFCQLFHCATFCG